MGLQRGSNYALKAASKEDFIRLVMDNNGTPPRYFQRVNNINRRVSEPIDTILKRNMVSLSPGQFMAAMLQTGYTVIDTREIDTFSAAHIPGSVFLGLEGNFELSAGLVLKPFDTLLIVCEPGKEKETFTRLARTGFEKAVGYLEGGMKAWKQTGASVETLENISAEDVAGRFRYHTDIIIDVRNPSEWIPGFIAGAKLFSLEQLDENITALDRKKNTYVYCSCGYRSMIAASILKRRGIQKVTNVSGGMMQLKQTPIPVRQLSRIS